MRAMFCHRSVSNLSYLQPFSNQGLSMASDGKVCRDWRLLIRSRCKCVLKKDHEWIAELSCVTYGRNLEATGAVGANLRPSSFGGFAGGPTLVNLEKTVYSTTHKTAINRPMDHTGATLHFM